MTGFSDSQFSALSVTMIIAGSLSILGGVFVTISWYTIPKENQGYAKKLLAWVSFSDVLTGTVYVGMGVAGTAGRSYLGDNGSCVTTAFFFMFSLTATFMWHLLVAEHMHSKMVTQTAKRSVTVCTIPCGRSTGKFKMRDIVAHAVVWPTSLVIALLPLVPHMLSKGEPPGERTGYYPTADNDICWISGPGQHAWRWSLVFVPLIAINIAIGYFYARILKLVLEGVRYARDPANKQRLRMAAARVAVYPVFVTVMIALLLVDEIHEIAGGEGAGKFATTILVHVVLAGKGFVHGLVFFFNAQNTERYGKVARSVRSTVYKQLSSQGSDLRSALSRMRSAGSLGSSFRRDSATDLPGADEGSTVRREEGTEEAPSSAGAWRVESVAGPGVARETPNPLNRV